MSDAYCKTRIKCKIYQFFQEYPHGLFSIDDLNLHLFNTESVDIQKVSDVLFELVADNKIKNIRCRKNPVNKTRVLEHYKFNF